MSQPVNEPVDLAIDAWRERARALSGFSPDHIDELEDHLRCALQRHLEAGMSDEAALQRAIDDIGDLRRVAIEYQKEDAMSAASKLLSTLVTVGLVVFAGSASGLPVFVHLPSLLFVPAFVMAGLWAGFGGATTRRAFVAALRGVDPLQGGERYREVFRRGVQLAWAAGGIGALIGVVNLLSNLDDAARIGPGLAMCLMSLLYAALLAEVVLRNLQHWVPQPISSR